MVDSAKGDVALERAEALLDSLIAGARSQRRAESYRKLARVLRDKVRRGDKYFDVKSVAEESARNGGPAEQTIRNSTGVEFRDLISVYADAVGGRSRQRSSAVSAQQDFATRLVAAVPDAQLRAEIALLVAEHRSFKRQIDILRASVSNGMVIKLDSGSPRAMPADGGYDSLLTEVELSAIERFLAAIGANEWTIAPDGRLLTRAGREIAGYGFLSALRTIIQSRLPKPPSGI